MVTGRLAVREYDDKEGRRRTSVDIEADAIGHDLSRGVTRFQRTVRSTGDEAGHSRLDDLAKSEAVRDGLSGDDLPGEDALDQMHTGHGPVSDAGGSGGMFDQNAVDALAGTAAEPVAVGAPF